MCNLKLLISLLLIYLSVVQCKYESGPLKVTLTRRNFRELYQVSLSKEIEEIFQETAEVFILETTKKNIILKLCKTSEKFYLNLVKSNLLKTETPSKNECFYGTSLIYKKLNNFIKLSNSWAALTICENVIEGFLLIENVGFLLEGHKEEMSNVKRGTREVNFEHLSNSSFQRKVSGRSFFNLTGDTMFDSFRSDEDLGVVANFEMGPVGNGNIVSGLSLGERDQKLVDGNRNMKVLGHNKVNPVYTNESWVDNDLQEKIQEMQEMQEMSKLEELNFTRSGMVQEMVDGGLGQSNMEGTIENVGSGRNGRRLDYESWLMKQNDEELGYFYDSAWKSVKTKSRNHNKSRNPHRFLEIIIAVDESVIRFHGRVRVKQYVLTLMNIVNALYQDPSLEANLQIVIREMHLYEKKRNVIRLGNAKKSLENVNLWNRDLHQIYGDDDEPHDIALWLTRTDIGGPSGYAPVGGVCDPERSCALTRDEGLTCAFIIAHELAHILGLSHDGDSKNNNTCRDESLQGSVMAPMVSATFHHFLWSECSRREFALKVSKWQCLLNAPDARRSIELNSTLGARFSMDEQCRVEFGDGYELCRSFDIVEPCAHLWCGHVSSPLVCKTKKGPPLEGTECGPQKWCVDGYCDTTLRLNLDPLKYNPQDGGWSAWGQWTACSRSCGLGVQFRSRTCDNPRPAYGGRDCDGLTEEWRICNTKECPEIKDFRAQQCTRMPSLLDVPRNLTWLPYESHQQSLKCNYICQSWETGEIYASEEFLTDGTPCSYDWDNKRCVQGQCVTIGCDNLVNSTVIKDGCSVCNGNNSECLRIKSHINKRIKKQITRLGVLHNQARHIAIEFTLNQDNPSGSGSNGGDSGNSGGNVGGNAAQIDFDLFLKDRKRNTFRIRKAPFGGELNRLFTRSRLSPRRPNRENNAHPNDVPMENEDIHLEPSPEENYGISITIVHGAKFRFHTLKTTNTLLVRNESLFLSTQGPLLKEMVLFIEIKNHRQHMGLKLKMDMEYLLHKRFKETRYEWIVGGWGSCSVSCGSGKRFKTKACVEKASQKIVARKFCSIVNKPPTEVQGCNTFSCNFVWIPGSWEPCSATCGTDGVQHREIYCVPQNLLNSTGTGTLELESPWRYMLPPNKCGYQPPPTTRLCNRTECPGHWEYGTWSECSSSCGRGEQSRLAQCTGNSLSNRSEVTGVVCSEIEDTVKVQTQSCNDDPDNEEECGLCEGDTSPLCGLESSLRYCMIESFKELCCESCNLHIRMT